MIVCSCCNKRKHSENFKIKVKLVNREVLFKICNDCGTTEDLEKQEWRDEMLDKGALDFQRPEANTNTDYWYKSKYNISFEDYDNMYKEQKGRCNICKKHQMDLSKRLVVDHCHHSGKVRSLLCSSCNTALGLIKEDKNTAINMIKYIQTFQDLKK